MNLTASNKIHVRVLLAADVVASVEIQPRVRPPLGRIFAGKQASSLLNAVPRLFALCAAAQQTALLTAIETARDEVITLAKKTASYCADRYRAHHGFGTGPICRTSHARGRQCGSNPLPDVGIVSACSLRPASLVPPPQREATARIAAALAALGVPNEGRALRSGSPLSLRVAALHEAGLKSAPAAYSFLSAADDFNIAKRLLGDDSTFCDCPDLEGHVPETGPWARQMTRDRFLLRPFGAAERLMARIVEIVRAMCLA
ncbi:hypothetical protein LPJ38_37250 [Bradyrhizobium daqingense]|nr:MULTISPECIES: hypothetical protein [Bradyrhizobium]UEM11626.1 hypothetical protein J4G43_045320 [Bradyrhizobium barranii subsp. barranii]UFS89134.1 hypothetical protein LPJ38_37250 [Bradyrhizobium daqingense]